MNKLEIELVPKSCWRSNIRSQVSKDTWEKIKKKTNAKSECRCEICGQTGLSQGYKWPVEVHEVWEYNDNTKTQTLKRMQSLCPRCHSVKHIGFAQISGTDSKALLHMCYVNNWTIEVAKEYIHKCFEIHHGRSRYGWTLDISLLTREYGIYLDSNFKEIIQSQDRSKSKYYR